ncbi:prolyl oligopeptidase family serine peptidase [Streptomyces sp. NPDC012888]|uniref:S9 family peptidase n=1 Tax=Streptomyces sp. NPDC012888 TaxID=3364855 RepID=UPI0036B72597
MGLPVWGRLRPEVCALRGNATGTAQFYLWDRAGGGVRQLTDAPHGVELGLLDPGGRQLWWYHDEDGTERGGWLRSPLRGGPAAPALPGVPAGTPEGLALGASGLAVAGVTGADGRAGVHLFRAGADRAVLLASADTPLCLGGLSDDEQFVLLLRAGHGDPQRPALRVVDTSGAVVGELDDGPLAGGLHVQPYGSPFAPGGRLVLATHHRRGRPEPLLWDPVTGEVTEIAAGLPGDVRAQFTPDGAGLLLHHRTGGRSELHRYRLADGAVERLPVPPGTVHDVAPRPDGEVWYTFSTATTPPVLRDLGGRELLSVPGPARPAAPVTPVGAPNGQLTVPVFLSVPEAGTAPYPTVFLLHGGPHTADGDEYNGPAAAWNDAGFAVARVNYRGSAENGTAWQFGHRADVGHTELSDVAAARAHLVAGGLADPDRCVLAGSSWGGYLTLLGLGTQPELWACGLAEGAVGDWPAAYREQLPSLRWVDRAMFGGSPDEVPERYAAASPHTYAAGVRAPLLVLAGDRDARCPAGQIESYVRALAARGHDVDFRLRSTGHASGRAEVGADAMSAQIAFVRSRLGAAAAGHRPAAAARTGPVPTGEQHP